MPLREVRDGDSDVARRRGRGLSIPALLSRCGEDNVPVIKNVVEEYLLPPMSITKTTKIIIKTAHTA